VNMENVLMFLGVQFSGIVLLYLVKCIYGMAYRRSLRKGMNYYKSKFSECSSKLHKLARVKKGHLITEEPGSWPEVGRKFTDMRCFFLLKGDDKWCIDEEADYPAISSYKTSTIFDIGSRFWYLDEIIDRKEG